MVGVVDDAVDLLERAPPLGYQLHRLLVPVVHPPLQPRTQKEREIKSHQHFVTSATTTRHWYHQKRSIQALSMPPTPAGSARRRAGWRAWKKTRTRRPRTAAAPTRRAWRRVARPGRKESGAGVRSRPRRLAVFVSTCGLRLRARGAWKLWRRSGRREPDSLTGGPRVTAAGGLRRFERRREDLWAGLRILKAQRLISPTQNF